VISAAVLLSPPLPPLFFLSPRSDNVCHAVVLSCVEIFIGECLFLELIPVFGFPPLSFYLEVAVLLFFRHPPPEHFFFTASFGVSSSVGLFLCSPFIRLRTFSFPCPTFFPPFCADPSTIYYFCAPDFVFPSFCWILSLRAPLFSPLFSSCLALPFGLRWLRDGIARRLFFRVCVLLPP